MAGRVAAVLVTHDHEDHAPGAPAFAERVGAPLYAFRLDGAEHLRDGQRFAASGDAEVIAEYTPGHSTDHVAFFVPSELALFTGDAVVGRGTSFIDPPDGDLVQYLRSLRSDARAVPAHDLSRARSDRDRRAREAGRVRRAP